MATLPTRDLKIGQIIDKTLAVIERCAMPALAYFAALAAINIIPGYYTLGNTAVLSTLGVAGIKFVFGVIAAFFALNAMIVRIGLRSRTDGDVFLSYLVLSVVYIVGVVLAFFVFILPGIYVMARWLIAQPLLLARGGAPMAALGESWEQTKEGDFQVFVALLVILVPVIAITIVATFSFGQASALGMVISSLASALGSVLALAMGVAVFGIIDTRERAAGIRS
jgi:hypothetical protein